MRSFFPYYGAKYGLASTYDKPKYPIVVEPFAGAAGYSLFWETPVALLVERYDRLSAVWDWLIHVPEDVFLRLPDEFDNLAYTMAAGPDRDFLGFWANPGSAQPKLTATTRCSWNGTIKKTLAKQLHKIRAWQVFRGSYADISPPASEHTFFVDPPYYHAGQYYHVPSKTIDYAHLAAWCRQLRGQVIVCENAGATWLPFRDHVTIRGSRKTSVEAIWP